MNEFRGEIINIREIARKTGRSEGSIRYRLKQGGIGYALSGTRNLKEYERRHHENISFRTDHGDAGCRTKVRRSRSAASVKVQN